MDNVYGKPRLLSYGDAIGEALVQAMEANSRVLLMGEGVDDPKGTFGTTLPAFKRFGPTRVFDTPLSEQAITGIGVGAALMGVPCVQVHLRHEFLLLAMDQVVNHAAKWRYMTGGRFSVPLTIRCIVGRGWGQAAQHSQSFHAMLAGVPGLKVVLPSNAYDAKGMLMEAVRDPNPVIFIEHRWLHAKTGEVPERPYFVPLDKAKVAREGKDVTCVSVSWQTLEALSAAERLAEEGIEMEVVDLEIRAASRPRGHSRLGEKDRAAFDYGHLAQNHGHLGRDRGDRGGRRVGLVARAHRAGGIARCSHSVRAVARGGVLSDGREPRGGGEGAHERKGSAEA